MGNWHRVRIVGTCGQSDVAALRASLNYDRRTMAGFHCLVNGGIAGLPNWAAENIDVVGNLAERSYDADSVAKTLDWLRLRAPSLRCKVHFGGDNEIDECVSTITLGDGPASVGAPEVTTIGEQSPEQMRRLFEQQLRHLS